MNPLHDVIKNKNIKVKPIWLMRQAGRYLPEFRKIRLENRDFIKLCLNEKLVPKITLQPLKRFDLDAAIIFSDILMLPHGLGQTVEFKKNFGPILGDLNVRNISNVSKRMFINKNKPVYKSMKKLSFSLKNKNKALIGFAGAPWTILVYMINKKSPKTKLRANYLNDKKTIKEMIKIITKNLKIHLEQQVKNGANVIQLFDSWAGLVKNNKINDLIIEPSYEVIKYVKTLGVPVIAFPRNIKNYKNYVNLVKPSAINIDYNVNPEEISKKINIPIQGGLDPKVLLTNKLKVKMEAHRLLSIFKDHPYIFNLGHGVLPQTKPAMVDYLVNIVKDF